MLTGQTYPVKPINQKKVIYFTAGNVATTAENDAITRLQKIYGTVAVRSGANLAATKYGANLETADAIAGTPPQAYTDAIGSYADGNVTQAALANPEALIIVGPAAFSAATQQYFAVKSDLTEGTNNVAEADVTATNTVWTSGTPATATVGAGTGLVTKVAAGTTVLTATYTAPGGTAKVATKTLTVS